MSSKRQSLAPPTPKPPLSVSPGTHISDGAFLIGTHRITISGPSPTLIHPRAKLNSTYGPITIGSNCNISERCIIGLSTPSDSDEGEGAQEGVTIHNSVVIEVGATVEAKLVGEGCLIEVNARVGRSAVLGKHCKIGPLCEVGEDEILPDFTVIYGFNMRRIDNSGVQDLQTKMTTKQIDVLRKLIPNATAKYQ